MKVGFTGTRNGLTIKQYDKLKSLLSSMSVNEFHHGDCVGADAESHNIASDLSLPIIIHPPIKEDLRAFKKSDILRQPKSYFARNRDIVNESDTLIATPATAEETQGGTWYTINYAIKMHKSVIIINPNGEIVKK